MEKGHERRGGDELMKKMEEKRMRGRGDGEDEGDGKDGEKGGADGTDEEEKRGRR